MSHHIVYMDVFVLCLDQLLGVVVKGGIPSPYMLQDVLDLASDSCDPSTPNNPLMDQKRSG
ncbi:MAG: hypothetical protein CL920_19200 [Deltaproteobacteria bacterium]|nr:hypothetical protein [Deltaproteobacteria bacterium]MBU50814.1 hypothetical protein [Deltaproteobacteria bacterium]